MSVFQFSPVAQRNMVRKAAEKVQKSAFGSVHLTWRKRCIPSTEYVNSTSRKTERTFMSAGSDVNSVVSRRRMPVNVLIARIVRSTRMIRRIRRKLGCTGLLSKVADLARSTMEASKAEISTTAKSNAFHQSAR